MPIRFACEHCNSVLSASSRKAGQEVTCPKCRQKTPVVAKPAEPATVGSEAPVAKPVVSPAPMPEVEPAPPKPAEMPAPELPLSFSLADDDTFVPPSDDASYDTTDEVTWVYEGGGPGAYSGGDDAVDFNRVSLPRYVLYGQGIMLLAVAMFALTLGIMIGRGSAPTTVVKSGTPTPCYLTGKVFHKSSGGQSVPDAGAVVIVVPQDERPTDKAPIEGLRPDDPLPDPDQPSLTRIKAIGGDYARTDEQGYFKLRVPDSGEYFLLVVSHRSARKASERLDPVHLAQMGRYFLPAPDLLGDRGYRWRSESIKRDKEYTFTFE